MAAMPFWMARWVRLPKPRTSCGGVVAWVERKVLIPYRPEDKGEVDAAHSTQSRAQAAGCLGGRVGDARIRRRAAHGTQPHGVRMAGGRSLPGSTRGCRT